MLNKSTKLQTEELSDDIVYHNDENLLENSLFDKISRDEILAFINTLSEKQRNVLVLKYSLGLSVDEIGKNLNISVSAVSKRLNLARKSIKKFIDERSKKMSESVFKSIIDEWVKLDWESYANAPEIKTSKKHDRAMQRIFKRYEKNTRRLRPQAEIRVRAIRRGIAVALMVIILAVITGFTAAYFISREFRGEIHSDNTELFPIDMDNCPTVIVEKNCLNELHEGFEEYESHSTPFSMSISYENIRTGQILTFEQWTKPQFDSVHYNTEKWELIEVDINGHYGVFLDLSGDNYVFSQVIWGNGDYVLKLSGDLSKNDLILLTKITKIFEK